MNSGLTPCPSNPSLPSLGPMLGACAVGEIETEKKIGISEANEKSGSQRLKLIFYDFFLLKKRTNGSHTKTLNKRAKAMK
jgi:hypothetical protein